MVTPQFLLSARKLVAVSRQDLRISFGAWTAITIVDLMEAKKRETNGILKRQKTHSMTNSTERIKMMTTLKI